jgi:predicted cupin superfamily sugar epimerase
MFMVNGSKLPHSTTADTFAIRPAAKVVADGWNFSTPLQNQAHTYSATTLAAGFNFSRYQVLEQIRLLFFAKIPMDG